MKLLIFILLSVSTTCFSQDSITYIYPEQFGAKGDGIADDLPALNSCSNYATGLIGVKGVKIMLRKIYRITDEWIIGTKCVNVSACFKNIFGDTSFSQVKYNLSRYVNNVSIIGDGSAGLYADFNDSTKLKAAIIYTLQGDTRAKQSLELYGTEISGFGIYTKGYFTNGIPNRYISSYNGNNQAGLVLLYNTGVVVKGITFFGFKEGLITNNSYFNNNINLRFDCCNRGYFTFESASSRVENTTFSRCNKAMEIRSSQMVLDNIYTTFCVVSLHLGTGSNVFKGTYFEGWNTGEAQMIVGDNPEDLYYAVGRNGLVDGVDFSGLTIVANKADKTQGVSILMKETARRVNITGGSLASSDKVFKNSLSEIVEQGVWETFQHQQIYKRDADATFKIIKLPALAAPTGTKQLLYINDKGEIIK